VKKVMLQRVKIVNKKVPKNAYELLKKLEHKYRFRTISKDELESFYALESLIIFKGDLYKERLYFTKRKQK